ncbi:MAG: SOS response-associated peptidase [Gammaproteobacteria bacterium]
MCGRFNLVASGEAVVEHFNLRRLPKYRPDYNIPPGQKILTVVALEDGSLKAVNLHWGLIPSWSKDRKISSRLINARAETLAEKPSFREAYRNRRCLIPATGFFEWQRNDSGKQPFHIHYPDNRLFAFAGLWEHWQDDNETVYSCTIVTTAANDTMLAIHQRMPVIIPPDHYPHWLDKDISAVDIFGFDQAKAYDNMVLTPISSRINNPLHNDEACLAPVRRVCD